MASTWNSQPSFTWWTSVNWLYDFCFFTLHVGQVPILVFWPPSYWKWRSAFPWMSVFTQRKKDTAAESFCPGIDFETIIGNHFHISSIYFEFLLMQIINISHQKHNACMKWAIGNHLMNIDVLFIFCLDNLDLPCKSKVVIVVGLNWTLSDKIMHNISFKLHANDNRSTGQSVFYSTDHWWQVW